MEDREIIENEKNAECEIVKEVREIRHKISARFDHDVGRLVAHYNGLQCHKRLWYEKNHPERKANISRSQQRRLDQSKEDGNFRDTIKCNLTLFV